MRTAPYAYAYPYRARRTGSTFGKVLATLASLLTIAAILFVGSREWKSDKSIRATLMDISNIRSLLSNARQAGSTSAQMADALNNAHNDVERSLIEKGTLVRSSSQPGIGLTPVGLSRVHN
jgi:hypothetical protein